MQPEAVLTLVALFVAGAVVAYLNKRGAQRKAALAAKRASNATVILPAEEDRNSVFYRLSQKVEEFAVKSAHPRDLEEQADFRALILEMSAPDIALDTLRSYALGANFPLACAAFVV